MVGKCRSGKCRSRAKGPNSGHLKQIMNTTSHVEKRSILKKLFYLGEIFRISFNKIFFFKDLKFLRKMQSSQTAQKDQTLATATLFWPLRTYILASGQK